MQSSACSSSRTDRKKNGAVVPVLLLGVRHLNGGCLSSITPSRVSLERRNRLFSKGNLTSESIINGYSATLFSPPE